MAKSGHVIYAHLVESGIKIGYTSNYKSRKASYSSHGDIIREIKVVPIPSKTTDDKLKKALYDLKLNVVIPNQSSTEVYNLDESTVIKLLTYIKNNKKLSIDTIKAICTNRIWVTKVHTLREFRNLYSITYNIFKFQRPIDDSHAMNISQYIQDNFSKLNYYMNPITVVKNQHDKYVIIDGGHRAKAICLIPNNHPSLDSHVVIHSCEVLLPERDCIEIFRNVNKCKPVAEIYLDDNYLKSLEQYLINELNKKYYPNCVLDKKSTYKTSHLHINKIKEFVTRKNITILMQRRMVKGTSKKEILDLLIRVNEFMHDMYVMILENDVFTGDIPIKDIDREIDWEGALNFHSLYNNRPRYSMNPFKQKSEKIRESYHESTKVIRKKGQKVVRRVIKEPFLLGLIIAASLIDVCLNIEDHARSIGAEID